jgi:hypothetical protein
LFIPFRPDEEVVRLIRETGLKVETVEFRATMQVSL